jgi:hypothetical protein
MQEKLANELMDAANLVVVPSRSGKTRIAWPSQQSIRALSLVGIHG